MKEYETAIAKAVAKAVSADIPPVPEESAVAAAYMAGVIATAEFIANELQFNPEFDRVHFLHLAGVGK